MADDFHNPASKAVPEDTVERLSKYRRSQGLSKEEYASTVTAFYNLITEFCEQGWGQSIHFALMEPGVSLEESIANHEYFLGEAIGLKPGMKAWADPNAPSQESSALRSWASTSTNISSGSALCITARQAWTISAASCTAIS